MKYIMPTLVLVTLGLCACGGGEEEEDEVTEDSSGAGIWNGTHRVDGQTTSYQMFGLVTEEGDFVIVSGGAPARMFFGDGAADGNSFSASARFYSSLGGVGSATLSGTITDRSRIVGSYSVTGESSAFTLDYRDIYERPASLATLAGVYSLPPNPQNITITIAINSDGTFTINNSAQPACVLNGTARVIHADRNYYRWTGIASSCGLGDGPLGGLIFMDDQAPGTNNRIVLFGQNDAQTSATWFLAVK